MSEFNAADVKKLLDAIGDEAIEFCHIRTASYEIVIAQDRDDPALFATNGGPLPERQVLTPAPQAATAPERAPVAAPAPAPVAPAAGATEGTVAVTAPMVGTFYRAPSPDAAPFVEVGSEVRPETTIGLIEAMKVFTSVPAGAHGVVASIEAENGSLVEFGAVVARLRPSSG